ncbi:MAG TPA: hydroxymethylglutaryl-CoA lyase [Chloroflexia bacterium]|nr:hydroxymethylglutaryl-CoA lyase [Chloroflexia bacterium]
MKLPARAYITEVGPRDGLQNEKELIPASAKVELIEALAATGLPSIEFTSFVSPKWVPQMADAEEVAEKITRRPGTNYQALVLNQKGLERALAAGVNSVALVVAASETLNKKNMNAGVNEALESYRPLLEKCRDAGVEVAGYASTACGCPYEGDVPVEKVMEVARAFLQMGADYIVLADTIGSGHPRQVRELCEAALKFIPVERLGVHFHDTRGMALANSLSALEAGISRFDGSIGGLGGCPFAPGAQGNGSTEDLVFMLEEMGVSTGINVPALVECARLAERLVGRPLPGHIKNATNIRFKAS